MKRRINGTSNVTTAGVSLIELLTTLMILSLAAMMTIGVAGPMAAGQRRAAAIGAVVQALEQARLIATARGGAALIAQRMALRIVPAGPGDEEHMTSLAIKLPADWSAILKINGEPAEYLNFDASGRCRDARFELMSRGTAFATIELLGISGQTRVLDPDATEALR